MWQVCAATTSNAIVLGKDGQALGIGAGQQSRVHAAEIAARKAGDRVIGGVCASDAFFPFRDGIEAAAAAGVTAVIQPGGSVRDDEVIAAATAVMSVLMLAPLVVVLYAVSALLRASGSDIERIMEVAWWIPPYAILIGWTQIGTSLANRHRMYPRIASATAGQQLGIAAVAALLGPKEVTRAMCAEYQQRRDFMVPALNAIESVECMDIEGAFYLFPRFPHSTKNSAELAEALIEKAGIASVPGGAFGRSGEGHVRFTIATAMSDLEKAVEKLAKVAHEL